MTDFFPVIAALVIWAGFAYKAVEWRRRRDRAQMYFSLACLTMALGLTVLNRWGYHLVDLLLGRPNIALLLGESFALTSAWLALLFLEQLRAGRVTAPRAWLYTLPVPVVLTIMWVAFVKAPTQPEVVGYWSGDGGASPGPPPSVLPFLAYVGSGFVMVAVRGIGWARVAQRSSIRAGIVLASVGGVFGVAFVVLDAARVLTDGELVIINPGVVDGAACALMVVGTTFPSWAAKIGFDDIAFSEWWALHRLFGFWRLLRRAAPEIALPPEPSRLGCVVRLDDAKWRLRRLVVETRDALLLLHVRWPDHQPSVSELEAELGLSRAADPRWLAAILAHPDRVGHTGGLEDEVRALGRLAATRPRRRGGILRSGFAGGGSRQDRVRAGQSERV